LRRFIIFLLFMSAAFSRASGGEGDAGTSSPFALGSGGRIISMGGAGTSLDGSSFSLHWNPSNLNGLERGEANIFHTSLFDQSVTYSSIYASYPFLDFGVISMGVVQLRIGGIERRNSENMITGDELDNFQTRYVIGYARNIYSNLAGGINMKLDRYAQGSYIANGFGVDAGMTVKTQVESPLMDGWSAGVALANIIEPKITLVSEESGDPRAFRVGFSFWRGISSGIEDRLLFSVDMDKNRYSETHFHLGGEYCIGGMFSLRGGWDDDIPTFGCGVKVRDFVVDYAYRDTELGGNHLFSVIFNFGTSRSERFSQRRIRRAKELRSQVEDQMMEYENRFISSSLKKGNEYLKGGDYAEAIENFRKVLMWSPDNGEARRNMQIAEASLNVLEGDSLASHKHFGEALLQYKKAYRSLQAPGIKRKIEKCEKEMGEATDKRKMTNQLFSVALEYYTSRRWNEALKAFQEVLEFDREHGLASQYLERTRQRINESRRRVMEQAESLISRKSYNAAVDLLGKAAKQFPADSTIRKRIEDVVLLIEKLESKKSIDEKRDQKVEQKPPPAEMRKLQAMFEEGIAFFKRGEFALAIEEWEKVWNIYRDFESVEDYLVRSYQYLGMEHYAHNEYQRALTVWKKILEIKPGHAKATRYIDRTREELEKLEGLTE
jgi:tetratricopeptide (TPR) repeat protein